MTTPSFASRKSPHITILRKYPSRSGRKRIRPRLHCPRGQHRLHGQWRRSCHGNDGYHHYYGGKPANFLDVGGGASKEKIAEGFKIILADPHVKAILVNIFGGIMNCATLAEGIIHACAELKVKVPLIVRMEGTNVEEGKKMLERSNLKITIAENLQTAAKLTVESTKR